MNSTGSCLTRQMIACTKHGFGLRTETKSREFARPNPDRCNCNEKVVTLLTEKPSWTLQMPIACDLSGRLKFCVPFVIERIGQQYLSCSQIAHRSDCYSGCFAITPRPKDHINQPVYYLRQGLFVQVRCWNIVGRKYPPDVILGGQSADQQWGIGADPARTPRCPIEGSMAGVVNLRDAQTGAQRRAENVPPRKPHHPWSPQGGARP